ncbi:hypothetical protein IWW50_004367 [Coemansia erecta]|nr:hypothetical protein GGF43_003704 [Coemansia sp. RSA 2618]KAJ2822086.1 hypothetical protein IWW50_004367 [Coemansia erecta]
MALIDSSSAFVAASCLSYKSNGDVDNDIDYRVAVSGIDGESSKVNSVTMVDAHPDYNPSTNANNIAILHWGNPDNIKWHQYIAQDMPAWDNVFYSRRTMSSVSGADWNTPAMTSTTGTAAPSGCTAASNLYSSNKNWMLCMAQTTTSMVNSNCQTPYGAAWAVYQPNNMAIGALYSHSAVYGGNKLCGSTGNQYHYYTLLQPYAAWAAKMTGRKVYSYAADPSFSYSGSSSFEMSNSGASGVSGVTLVTGDVYPAAKSYKGSGGTASNNGETAGGSSPPASTSSPSNNNNSGGSSNNNSNPTTSANQPSQSSSSNNSNNSNNDDGNNDSGSNGSNSSNNSNSSSGNSSASGSNSSDKDSDKNSNNNGDDGSDDGGAAVTTNDKDSGTDDSNTASDEDEDEGEDGDSEEGTDSDGDSSGASGSSKDGSKKDATNSSSDDSSGEIEEYGGLTRGALIAVATIVPIATIIIIVALFFTYRWWKRRQNARSWDPKNESANIDRLRIIDELEGTSAEQHLRESIPPSYEDHGFQGTLHPVGKTDI